MGGAEGVVDIHLSQAGQIFAESGQVLGLFLAETGVLQQHNVAVLHGSHSGLGVLAHHVVVVGEDNVLAQQLAQTHSYGSQAELGLGTVLGFAQMAAQDDPAAVFNQLLDGGQSGNDAVVVGDNAVLHGDVEIAANQYPFALYVDVFYSLFAQRAHC